MPRWLPVGPPTSVAPHTAGRGRCSSLRPRRPRGRLSNVQRQISEASIPQIRLAALPARRFPDPTTIPRRRQTRRLHYFLRPPSQTRDPPSNARASRRAPILPPSRSATRTRDSPTSLARCMPNKEEGLAELRTTRPRDLRATLEMRTARPSQPSAPPGARFADRTSTHRPRSEEPSHLAPPQSSRSQGPLAANPRRSASFSRRDAQQP
mmetsp:Transcript_10868/g.34242  ORF Transcript_10868/g.34242 Transcript_10868/m.34242 type:complete len:209 (+) Transcript_10868:489-1115(+)